MYSADVDYDKVAGLKDALAEGKSVGTIYNYDSVDKTWDMIKGYKAEQGEAIFTQPFGPVKCAGGTSITSLTITQPLIHVAPQKIAYMADSYWRESNTPLPSRSFITGMPTMFSVPHYSKALDAIRQEKGIAAEFNTNLVAVDSAKKVATFEVLAGENKGKKVEKEFGMLHVVPPMGPLDWIKKSPLADAAGWVDVHQGTLQSTKYDNVFSLGDASSLPTSKVSDLH